jgi:putative hydrolase of the HAD superfamily
MNKLSTLQQMLTQSKVIGFDLDDTLWDNKPVIKRAITLQFDFLQKQLPDLSRDAIEQEYATMVKQALTHIEDSGDVKRCHDMSLLRQMALKSFCESHHLDEAIAHQTYDVFYQARQQFIPFPEAEKLLELLAKKFRLVAISNGNASLVHSELNDYFSFHWRAGVDGKAKPDPDMLLKAMADCQVSCNEFIYVGDSLDIDGAAANRANSFCWLLSDLISEKQHSTDRQLVFRSISELLSSIEAIRPS